MELREHRAIQSESNALHGEEHVGEGHLHLIVEETHALLPQFTHHHVHQGEQQPRRGRFAVQSLKAEGGEAVDGVVAVEQVVGDHTIENHGAGLDAVLAPGVQQGLLVEGQHLGGLA